MLYKGLLLLIVIGAMALLGGTEGLAQSVPEATPEPNSPQDNACFEGGTLWRENGDGCPTEWYWKAGWYLARVETGEIPVEDVPDEFESAMPPQEEKPPVITICHDAMIYAAAPWMFTRECLSSDGTGSSTVTGGGPVGKLHLRYSIYPSQVTCLGGFSSSPVSPFFNSAGFTSEELRQLGFENAWYCVAFFWNFDDTGNPIAYPIHEGLGASSSQGCTIPQGYVQAVVDRQYHGTPARIIALNLNGFAITPDERSIVATQDILIPTGLGLQGTYTLNGGSTAEIRWGCS